LPTKDEQEKLIKVLKEETAKLQKVNKQRFDRITELEEIAKIQNLQLSLMFEVLKHDGRHKGFISLVQVLGAMKSFWKNKPVNKLEQQIREMEENGLLFFQDEDDDFDGWFRKFGRKK
tara:strand:+ start:1311 stop:1664 length:354 start_codon:yes stop_codon:yes gene_type:complete